MGCPAAGNKNHRQEDFNQPVYQCGDLWGALLVEGQVEDAERVSTFTAGRRYRPRPGRPTDGALRKTDFLSLRRAAAK